MITGSLKHWPDERHFVHPLLLKALDYLAETDFDKLEDGKYPIQGDEMYAQVMTIQKTCIVRGFQSRRRRRSARLL
ncbi:YhcH/YjgK/YiaL family protein [Paenibacillus agaridevorans]|uniref:YhcH/YjgK/YiaL family protein n=1 Tax=Paenibacillus agaridevorans TaxID=171404 RepID=UPI001BE42E47|nr:YhcH/YjgK/YiaL family protein [Paenibacillus agaridevorans]